MCQSLKRRMLIVSTGIKFKRPGVVLVYRVREDCMRYRDIGVW